MTAHETTERLLKFLREVTGQAALHAASDLAAAGVTDSLTMMDLMVFIETEFSVRLDFQDLNPEVFRSPATIADVLVARQAAVRQLRAA